MCDTKCIIDLVLGWIREWSNERKTRTIDGNTSTINGSEKREAGRINSKSERNGGIKERRTWQLLADSVPETFR